MTDEPDGCVTARGKIWIHSHHGTGLPLQYDACEWYGATALLDAFLEAQPGEDLPTEEWLDVTIMFVYEEGPPGYWMIDDITMNEPERAAKTLPA